MAAGHGDAERDVHRYAVDAHRVPLRDHGLPALRRGRPCALWGRRHLDAVAVPGVPLETHKLKQACAAMRFGCSTGNQVVWPEQHACL